MDNRSCVCTYNIEKHDDGNLCVCVCVCVCDEANTGTEEQNERTDLV